MKNNFCFWLALAIIYDLRVVVVGRGTWDVLLLLTFSFYDPIRVVGECCTVPLLFSFLANDKRKREVVGGPRKRRERKGTATATRFHHCHSTYPAVAVVLVDTTAKKKKKKKKLSTFSQYHTRTRSR